MKKIAVIAAMVVLGIALITGTSQAATPMWSGVSTYNYGGALQWTATITWEVYAPGDSYIGNSPYYAYYYTIHSDASSIGSITQFSIGNPGLMPIYAYGSQDTGGITPKLTELSTGQIAWTFGDSGYDGTIDPGETSDRLYFLSTWPDFVDGGLQGSGGNNYQRLPGPGTPEPASMALLGLGLVGFVGKSIRRKFKA